MKRSANSGPPRDPGVLWLLIPLVLTVLVLAAMVAFSAPNNMLPDLDAPPDPGAASMSAFWALPPAADPSVPPAHEALSGRPVEAVADAPPSF